MYPTYGSGQSGTDGVFYLGGYMWKQMGNSKFYYRDKKVKTKSLVRKSLKKIVYIIKTIDQDIYKIGHSRDKETMRKRILLIKCYCPLKIILFGYIDCYDAERTEKEIHWKLKAFRFNGEWFNMPDINTEIFKNYHNYSEVMQPIVDKRYRFGS